MSEFDNKPEKEELDNKENIENGEVDAPQDKVDESQPVNQEQPNTADANFRNTQQNNASPNFGNSQQFNPNQYSQPNYNSNKTSYVYYGNNYNRPPYQNNMNYNGSRNPYQNQVNQPNLNTTYQDIHNSKSPNNPHGQKKGSKIFALCIAIIAVIAIGLTVYSVRNGSSKIDKGQVTEKIDAPELQVQQSSGSTSAEINNAKDVYNTVKDSSVGVLVYFSNSTSGSGEGSGVIVGEDAKGEYTYVITCAHVVSGASSIKIQLSDETQYDAYLVGADSQTDIAVIRVHKTGFKAISIGDSQALEVGDTVYAIGNPGGTAFAGSFTNGIVSAISRPVNSQIGYEMLCIQHTAPINPGNSGGALVNSQGQLIGINSSKISGSASVNSASYEGMGFAVPSETFVKVYNDIVAHGYVTNRPKLGINYKPASAVWPYNSLVSAEKLPAGALVIDSIQEDSALRNTDVRRNDIITKVNGKELDTIGYLPSVIEKSNIGDSLTLTIVRVDGDNLTEFDVTVALVENKGNTSATNYPESTTQSQSYYNPWG